MDAAFIRAAEPTEKRPKDNPDAERLRAELAADKQAAQRTIEDVRAEMAAERAARDAAGEPLGPNSRLWFADVTARQYVPGPLNETPVERKQREDQNERYRKEYKKALRVVRKQHENGITRNRKVKFTERMRLLNEIQKEFDYRIKVGTLPPPAFACRDFPGLSVPEPWIQRARRPLHLVSSRHPQKSQTPDIGINIEQVGHGCRRSSRVAFHSMLGMWLGQ